jgi:hypothetical protein
MTGISELNFPAFNQEAERLRAEGLQVLNPADHGIVDGADWADYLRHDIAGLASCERIHLLRGWTKSKGACLEMTIAKALGMTVTYQVDAEMEHNNAPAVPQGLERYEPTVMVEESRGRLTATGAVMKPKEDGRWVRLRDLTATPTPAPAQGEPFGYFRAEPFGWTDCAKDDEGAIALYERPQEVGLIARQFDLICQAIDKADTATMEGDYMLDSDDCINVVRVMQALFDVTKPAQEVDESQLEKMRERGATAWAGVDAQSLRAGGEPAQEVGLTDEEIEDVFEQHKGTAGKELRATIGRAIISALRAKGGK